MVGQNDIWLWGEQVIFDSPEDAVSHILDMSEDDQQDFVRLVMLADNKRFARAPRPGDRVLWSAHMPLHARFPHVSSVLHTVAQEL